MQSYKLCCYVEYLSTLISIYFSIYIIQFTDFYLYLLHPFLFIFLPVGKSSFSLLPEGKKSNIVYLHILFPILLC